MIGASKTARMTPEFASRREQRQSRESPTRSDRTTPLNSPLQPPVTSPSTSPLISPNIEPLTTEKVLEELERFRFQGGNFPRHSKWGRRAQLALLPVAS